MKNLKNIKQALFFGSLGLIIGITGALSFLRTKWEFFNLDFFFWWSVVSTLIGFGFVVISVWQYWENQSQAKKSNAQIKVWMQDANGISKALQRVVKDNLDGRYSSTNDMGNAVWSVEATASALYQSLYEERCVTEEQYITRQRKIAELLDKQQFAELEQKADQATAMGEKQS